MEPAASSFLPSLSPCESVGRRQSPDFLPGAQKTRYTFFSPSERWNWTNGMFPSGLWLLRMCGKKWGDSGIILTSEISSKSSTCSLSYPYHDVAKFSSVQSLNRVQLFVTPWIAARQASLSITNSRSSLRLASIESIMPSSHLILCCPLLLLPPIPPSIRVFSNESTLHMRWPKYWSFSFSISPPKKSQGWSPSEWTGWISLQTKGLSRVFSSTTVQKHQFFSAQLSSQSNSHIHTWPLEKP